MTLANSKELEEKQKEERRRLGIPDDVDMNDFHIEKIGPCHFCKKEVSDYNWCYGCLEFICSDCDTNDVNISRGHKIEDHQI